MPTKQHPHDLARNRTVRRFPAPEPSQSGSVEPAKRAAVLTSQTTRRSRKVRAHLRSLRRVGGKAKHVKHFLSSSGQVRMSPKGEPYETRATAQRPWQQRAKNRAKSKRSRTGRRNARA